MRHRAPPSASLSFDLRIDELVLDGFPPGERFAIAAAFERELTRILSGPAAPFAAAGGPRRMDAGRMDAGRIILAPGGTARTTGIEAARAVGRNLGRMSGTPSAGGKQR